MKQELRNNPVLIAVIVAFLMFVVGLAYRPILYVLLGFLMICALLVVLVIMSSGGSSKSSSSVRAPAAPRGSFVSPFPSRARSGDANSSNNNKDKNNQAAGPDNLLFVVVVIIGLLLVVIAQ